MTNAAGDGDVSTGGAGDDGDGADADVATGSWSTALPLTVILPRAAEEVQATTARRTRATSGAATSTHPDGCD